MNGRLWTKEEDEKLRELYPDKYASELVEVFGRSVSAIHGRANLLGIKSTPEKIMRTGREAAMTEGSRLHQFKKGSIPMNKGQKMSAEVYARCSATMFKKGNTPKNHRPVGSERVTRDGYVEVKVAEPNKWKLKHRLIWEEANGKIPKGYNIQFRNGDSLDLRIENLYIIDRKSQMRDENSLVARYPKELADVIRLKGAVNRKLRKLSNG